MKDSKATAAPRGRQHIIRRPRLLRLLDESTARIIMLVAPAGYGKTTLARQWLAEGDRRYVWYRATAASHDVAALAGQLSRSVDAIVADVGDRVAEHLRAAGTGRFDERLLTDLFVTSLRKWPDDTWLAIDDYHHLLGSAAAESLVRELIDQAQIPLMIVTRGRPSWATARRLLYHEVLEVPKDVLALTRDEALEVLPERNASEVDALAIASSGWPAVIGLASFKAGSLSMDREVAGELYEFFADELYRTLPHTLQRGLCSLAPATLIDSSLVDELFGPDAEELVRAAQEAGFLTYFERAFDLHPLLRAFLLQKSRIDADPHVFNEWDRVIKFLMRTKRWDDAFTAITVLGENHRLPRLVDEALDDLLLAGRLDTLVKWLRGPQVRTSPVLQLALSEIALRQGDLKGTERSALRAANSRALAQHRRSRAWFRAGHAAYLLDDTERAFGHLTRARQLAQDDSDLSDALWGLFMTSADREDGGALDYLQEYRRAAPLNEDTELRVATGLALHANRFGGIRYAIERLDEATPLVSRSTNPLIRSAFLNSSAYVRLAAARYAEALPLIDAALDEAARYGLAFVAPHAYLARAAAFVGLRQLRDAGRSLTDAEAAVALYDDLHTRMFSELVKARFYIAQGDLEQASSVVERDWEHRPYTGLYAHYLGVRALLCASTGDHEEALDLAATLPQMTSAIEASTFGRFATAIVEHCRDERRAAFTLLDAFHQVESHGNLDTFVTAYRAYPDLLVMLHHRDDVDATLSEIIAASRDTQLAADALIHSSRPSGTGEPLSPRELQVYDLLATGASNREIAQRLFISEATVKAHIRHIFAKLGVRTRTQAALRLKEVERLNRREPERSA